MSGMSGNSSGVSQPPYREGTPRSVDASSTAICSGAHFSIYVLRELIGAGSMANVYRAHDARLRREVAVKILNPGALPGADGLARFLHEARMAASIRHPNVVNIFDVGVHDGAPYIVMELLEGEALDMRLRVARTLREPALVDIAIPLISGLAAVHDAGVVHRDVRLSNVFLARGPGGTPQTKLLDFSISKQTHDNLRLTTNGRRRWMGMPLYTAPEVLLDGDATPHSDQYSLGVLLYECITGVNPFRAETTLESIQLITTGQATRVRDQPIRPSRRLAAIIEKAMHVYPERRFGDLRELGEALIALSDRRGRWPWVERVGGLGAAAHSGSAHPASVPPRARPRPPPVDRSAPSERRLTWAIGGVVVACSVAAPVWAWWSVHRHRDAEPVSLASPLAASDGPAPVGEGRSPAGERGVPAGEAVPSNAQAAAPDAPPAAPSSAPAPAGNDEAHASIEPDPLTAPALVNAASPLSNPASAPVPEQGAAPAHEEAASVASAALEGAAPASGAAFGAIGEGAAGAQPPLASSPAPAALEGAAQGSVDSGVSLPPDAGGNEARDPAGMPLPSVAAPISRHERGTNGALIFD